jgi:archaellum component FlaG (FlaF/FlaG flagellin family)
MSELAVKGCTIEASLEEGKGSISASPLTITNQPSDKNFVGDNGIYFDKITVQIPATTTVTLNSTPEGASTNISEALATPTTIDISGTADNIINVSDEKKAVQKDDEGSKTITFLFKNTASPPSPTVQAQIKVIVKVTDAGQTAVIAT